ncbi:MAG: hypothetical protein DME28_06915 [Verrucomicrobia bacterium]|nr:MAG: hypothetical protein DME28_06915 [Verrucomicrobiota bacterium]
MTHRLKFVVLTGLILLGPQARNTLVPRSDVELQPFALDLNLSRLVLDSLKAGGAFSELRFEMSSLQRQISNLVLDLPDLLLSILKDE